METEGRILPVEGEEAGLDKETFLENIDYLIYRIKSDGEESGEVVYWLEKIEKVVEGRKRLTEGELSLMYRILRGCDFLYDENIDIDDLGLETVVDLLSVLSFNSFSLDSLNEHSPEFSLPEKPHSGSVGYGHNLKYRTYEYVEEKGTPYRVISNFDEKLLIVLRSFYVLAEVIKNQPQVLIKAIENYISLYLGGGKRRDKEILGTAIGMLDMLNNVNLIDDSRFESLTKHLTNIALSQAMNFFNTESATEAFNKLSTLYPYLVTSRRDIFLPHSTDSQSSVNERISILPLPQVGYTTQTAIKMLKESYGKNPWNQAIIDSMQGRVEDDVNQINDRARHLAGADSILAAFKDSTRNTFYRTILVELSKIPKINTENISKEQELQGMRALLQIFNFFKEDPRLSGRAKIQLTTTILSLQQAVDNHQLCLVQFFTSYKTNPIAQSLMSVEDESTAGYLRRWVEESPESIYLFFKSIVSKQFTNGSEDGFLFELDYVDQARSKKDGLIQLVDGITCAQPEMEEELVSYSEEVNEAVLKEVLLRARQQCAEQIEDLLDKGQLEILKKELESLRSSSKKIRYSSFDEGKIPVGAPWVVSFREKLEGKDVFYHIMGLLYIVFLIVFTGLNLREEDYRDPDWRTYHELLLLGGDKSNLDRIELLQDNSFRDIFELLLDNIGSGESAHSMRNLPINLVDGLTAKEVGEKKSEIVGEMLSIYPLVDDSDPHGVNIGFYPTEMYDLISHTSPFKHTIGGLPKDEVHEVQIGSRKSEGMETMLDFFDYSYADQDIDAIVVDIEASNPNIPYILWREEYGFFYHVRPPLGYKIEKVYSLMSRDEVKDKLRSSGLTQLWQSELLGGVDVYNSNFRGTDFVFYAVEDPSYSSLSHRVEEVEARVQKPYNLIFADELDAGKYQAMLDLFNQYSNSTTQLTIVTLYKNHYENISSSLVYRSTYESYSLEEKEKYHTKISTLLEDITFDLANYADDSDYALGYELNEDLTEPPKGSLLYDNYYPILIQEARKRGMHYCTVAARLSDEFFSSLHPKLEVGYMYGQPRLLYRGAMYNRFGHVKNVIALPNGKVLILDATPSLGPNTPQEDIDALMSDNLQSGETWAEEEYSLWKDIKNTAKELSIPLSVLSAGMLGYLGYNKVHRLRGIKYEAAINLAHNHIEGLFKRNDISNGEKFFVSSLGQLICVNHDANNEKLVFKLTSILDFLRFYDNADRQVLNEIVKDTQVSEYMKDPRNNNLNFFNFDFVSNLYQGLNTYNDGETYLQDPLVKEGHPLYLYNSLQLIFESMKVFNNNSGINTSKKSTGRLNSVIYRFINQMVKDRLRSEDRGANLQQAGEGSNRQLGVTSDWASGKYDKSSAISPIAAPMIDALTRVLVGKGLNSLKLEEVRQSLKRKGYFYSTD